MLHLSSSPGEKRPVDFVKEKGPLGPAGSKELMVSHLLGGMCGGVLMEHSLRTDCLISELEWHNGSPFSHHLPHENPELLRSPSLHPSGLGGVVVAKGS